MSLRTINKVTLIGNVVNRPEGNLTRNGVKVVTFYVMTDRKWKTGNEYRTASMSHACTAWAGLGDVCEKILDVGDLVYIEGRLENKRFTSTEEVEQGDGTFVPVRVEKEVSEVVIDEMILLRKGRSGLDDETSDNITNEMSKLEGRKYAQE